MILYCIITTLNNIIIDLGGIKLTHGEHLCGRTALSGNVVTLAYGINCDNIELPFIKIDLNTIKCIRIQCGCASTVVAKRIAR